LVLGLALGLSGCELFGFKEPEPPPPEPALPSPRLAPARLPFQLANDLTINNGAIERLNFGRRVEVGPEVATSLFIGSSSDLTRQVMDSLLAVAALPDRVVVVFPAAPDGVMTVAQGGLDLPWTAAPLDPEAPLRRFEVGALDAVVAPDGAVLIAVRKRPFGLVLYRWTPGGPTTKEPVPVGATPTEHWSNSRCPDVRLDATARGGVVLAYSAGKHAALAWRKPAATTWTEHLTPPLEYDDTVHFDMGCTNRVLFDASGLPQLLSLVRTFKRKPGDPEPYDPRQPGYQDPAWNLPDFHPRGLLGLSPPVTGFHGYTMRADGLLSRNTSVRSPEAFNSVDHPGHVGFAAFERHPGGYLLSGPRFEWGGGSLAYSSLQASGPALDPASLPPDFRIELRVDSYEVETPGGGYTQVPVLTGLGGFMEAEHLSTNPCGDVRVWTTSGEYRSLGRGARYNSVVACLGEPLAPVGHFVEAAGHNKTPAFAHGERPYEVGVCSAGTNLVICHGGHEPTTQVPSPEETAPRVVSTVPPPGELPLTTERVSVTLSRAPEAGERFGFGVVRVDQLEGEWVTPVMEGATATVPLPSPLAPGATYRVLLGVISEADDRWWLYLDGGAPAVTFTTAKTPGVVDTRVSPSPFRCDGVRDGGTCDLAERVRGEGGGYDELGHSYDYAARPLGVPSVYDAQGNRVVDATAQVMPTGQTRFTWGSTLARDARYEARFPPGIVTFEGTEWFPEDLKLGFFTRP
jgi:hypothetical protein